MKQQNLLKNKIVVCTLAIICCLLWGSAFPCIKIGYKLFEIIPTDVMSQVLFAGIRFFIAGVFTIIIGSLLQKNKLYPKISSMKYIIVLSMFQTIIQYFFFYIGLAHSSGVKSSIINGMSTFFAIILASLVRKQEKFTLNKLLGCICGSIGVILVSMSNGDIMGNGFSLFGEGFILIASVSYAISSVLIKDYSQKENPVTLSGYQFLLGGAVMIIVSSLAGGRIHITNVYGFVLLMYMALISSVAYSIWGILLKYNPVSSVTIYGFSNPIFGTMLSAILLSEWNNLNSRCLAALVLVSFGIYLVNREIISQ